MIGTLKIKVMFNIVCLDRDDLQLTIELEVTSGQLIIQLKVTRKKYTGNTLFGNIVRGYRHTYPSPDGSGMDLFFI